MTSGPGRIRHGFTAALSGKDKHWMSVGSRVRPAIISRKQTDTMSEHIAPHDLRSCAKLCHDRGGELEQIQFLLGHASVQTKERYLGCKQNLGHPANDLFDLRLDATPQPKPDDSIPATTTSEAIKKVQEPGIECGYGEWEHAPGLGDTKHISIPERTGLVEDGKKHRPEGLRRCQTTSLLPKWGNRIALGIEPLEVEQWLKDLKRERKFANPTLDKPRSSSSAIRFSHKSIPSTCVGRDERNSYFRSISLRLAGSCL